MKALAYLVVVSLCACGSSHSPIVPDAGSGSNHVDAPSGHKDAPSVDAANSRITVTVYGDGTDAAAGTLVTGVSVYFTAPDATVQVATTGSDGVASVEAPNGAAALVARQYSATQWSLTTFVGLVGGDSIVAGISTPTPNPASLGSITFSLPAQASAQSYEMLVSCASTVTNAQPSISVPVTGCANDTAANAVGVALGSNNVPLAYTFLSGQNLSTLVGTTVTMPAFQSVATVSGTFTNLPSTTSSVLFKTSYHTATDPVVYGFASVTGAPSGGSLDLSSAIVPFGGQTHFSIVLTETGYATIGYIEDDTTQEASLALDASGMITPSTGGTYGSANDEVTWTEAATGVVTNFVDASIAWMHDGIVVGYEFASPRGATAEVPVPPLPSALSAIQYAPTEAFYNGVTLFEVPGMNYHDVLVAPNRESLTRWVTSF
jgi:hypothetical protein